MSKSTPPTLDYYVPPHNERRHWFDPFHPGQALLIVACIAMFGLAMGTRPDQFGSLMILPLFAFAWIYLGIRIVRDPRSFWPIALLQILAVGPALGGAVFAWAEYNANGWRWDNDTTLGLLVTCASVGVILVGQLVQHLLHRQRLRADSARANVWP